MLNRKLIISAIMFSGTFFGVSFSAQAVPANQDVFFNGTYASGCQFNSKTDGTVTPNALFSATSLGSTATYNGATSGEVKVICSSLLGAVVTASEPEAVTAPTGATFSVKASLLDGLPGTTGKVITGNAESTIKVDMTATSASPIPTGDYRFKVIVTATPN
ncbi:hypothetical protein [Rivularia sp. UHCC 0363]|uniref:hypothetical protein n=1 Tax=Rivularia sp. UHCC 0363 TaxID=3110244 RepID=UPI002B1F6CDE|nr:hypothetical protein [Rivularia sp. UHCC 0363]MEA5593896.1 hypothetical protein [Rivularia sp. UHCC 0363]